MTSLDVVLLLDDTTRLAQEESAETFLFASEAIDAIEDALTTLGHRHRRLSFDLGVSRVLARLSNVPPDVVFLLGQPVPTDPLGEARVAAALELLGIAHTSESPEALILAADKARAKAICTHHGLPTPPHAVAAYGELPRQLPPGPWIAKPALEDGSRGIAADACTSDRDRLADAVSALYARFDQPVVVETFINGREFQIGLVGEDLLPVVEIDFSSLPAGAPRIASYESKWKYESVQFAGVHYACPVDISASLAGRLADLARRTAAAFGLRRCARLDVRTDSEEGVWLLDVNPNPDLSPVATMHRMAQVAGWEFPGLVQRLLDLALAGRFEAC